ncbi:hypothetical protein Kpol_487p5 [Vanderwaltozyma polyspora DSM 70294]|uniref:Large ribosomal subunit protein bL27m n=1 Tax=Vanderwaltozyma polyspora (strain ATCC 22028 / DSM 70294 / BCRC 21397 / CBS 2163 / NBRC 10782 / NRRL Y-8283 / UCD 57-17) TaxID=436907 RepID=A7TQ80_VANPO|nr:uncharacterized protein Kpol_487p5 [Vanderwaltozyma polyspora DSM 70294]EDO15572.1 hypothetical protein Kpol_487p5 [Vanderwaltozyma polyspora DSM 70294]
MLLLDNLKSSLVKKNACSILTQVRNSTKRASGSRTNMKDSPGKRLGPKKYDGQEVKVGQIIMRQRGTKFFPGENVGIGKDHTIFAKEHGVVRYYLDPFHPGRKFIGVSLKRELPLPTPHFNPRVRRFGHRLITDTQELKIEEENIPRKQRLVKDQIIKELNERESARDAKKMEHKKVIEQLKLELNESQMDLALNYLLRYRTCLRNGFNLQDSQFNAQQYLKLESILSSKKNSLSKEDLDANLKSIELVSSLLNKNVEFNNKFDLIKLLSAEEKQALKNQLLESLGKYKNGINNKEEKDTVMKLFSNACDFLTLSEEVHLRRQYLKSVQPENPSNIATKSDKKVIITRRFNYEKHRVDTIPRIKNSFLKRM